MIEIAERIFYIKGGSGGRYPDCHALLVKVDTSAIIDPAGREELMSELAADPGVGIVLNTHYHEDHRAYNFHFSGARLLVHELDAHGYGSVEDFMAHFSLVNNPNQERLWLAFLLETCKFRPYTVDQTFADGYEIDLGHTLIEVVHTPGHSAGHCCFFFPREAVAYLGDLDLTSFGPWYAGDDSDIDAFLSSIERMRELRPRVVVTSHGDGLITENVDGRLEEYADIIHQRDSSIEDFVTRSRSLEEILALEIIYRKNHKSPDSFFYGDDRRMIEMHLDRLVRLGRLGKDDESYSPA
jgi:glyoxylase-like metal-dependent hydrolase (beta-lactamase superfamily II)